MLASNGLLGISNGLGGLSLNATSLAVPGIIDQQAQQIGSLSSKPFTSEQLTRNSLTSVGMNTLTSNATLASSLPFSPDVSPGSGLPLGWISMADPEGRVFFFNSLTGVAQWSSPLAQ